MNRTPTDQERDRIAARRVRILLCLALAPALTNCPEHEPGMPSAHTEQALSPAPTPPEPAATPPAPQQGGLDPDAVLVEADG